MKISKAEQAIIEHLHTLSEGFAIEYFKGLDDSMKTEAVCIEAVRCHSILLGTLTDTLKTEAVCLNAIEQEVAQVWNVPLAIQTEDFHSKAMASFCNTGNGKINNNNLNVSYYIQRVWMKSLSERNIFEAIQFYPNVIAEISPEQLTQEHYIAAVQLCPESLEHVPLESITETMCDAAVAGNWRSLEFVPEEFKTLERCNIAVTNNYQNIKYTPIAFLTADKVERILTRNGYIINYLPDELINLDRVLMATRDNIDFENIPEDYQFHPDVLNAYFDCGEPDAIYNLPHETFGSITEEDLSTCLLILSRTEYFERPEGEEMLANTLYRMLSEETGMGTERLDLFEQVFEQMDRLKFKETKAHRKLIEIKEMFVEHNKEQGREWPNQASAKDLSL